MHLSKESSNALETNLGTKPNVLYFDVSITAYSSGFKVMPY